MKRLFRRKNRWASVLLMLAIFLISCTSEGAPSAVSEAQFFSVSDAVTSADRAQTVPSEAFDTVMSVLTHPRCINCHPSDDRPRQKDEQIMHILNVTRGEENHGGPVQTCETCHHQENNPYSRVPGAPHWGLAPKSMGWLGLSEREIALSLIDPEKNGDRTFEELLHHLSEDPLVLWAWEAGEGRTPPPVTHAEFVQAVEAWLEAGAPIPAE